MKHLCRVQPRECEKRKQQQHYALCATIQRQKTASKQGKREDKVERIAKEHIYKKSSNDNNNVHNRQAIKKNDV